MMNQTIFLVVFDVDNATWIRVVEFDKSLMCNMVNYLKNTPWAVWG